MESLRQLAVIFLIVQKCHSSITTLEPGGSSQLTASDYHISQDGSWPPNFCKSLDCPKFTVVNTTKDYEIRDYDASQWVSTKQLGIVYDQARSAMFMRLFYYISGRNSQEKKIAMTVPVISRIIPGQGPACENNFTRSFYISDSVTNPPSPTNNQVFLTSLPQMRVYVRSFGGFASQSDYIQNARALAEALPASAKYAKDYFYTAGYDGPFKLFNRHNEVWFIGI